MAMTNEEIDAEIARLTALKEQNNRSQAAESNKPADGVYNPADYIGQITSKMNEASYTDEQGNKKSYGYGDKFSGNLDVAKNAGKIGNRTEDQFGNPLPDTAYEYITQMLNSERAKGSVSKHTLRMIENEAKARYNLPRKFDISGIGIFGNTDKKMAKAMNSMPYNGKAQPAQPAQAPQKPVEQQPVEQQPAQTQDVVKKEQEKPVPPKTQLDDERTAAYKRIKAKQASDADLDLFKNYTEEQLQKIGFGPISIKAIKERSAQSTASSKTQQAIESNALDPSTGKKPEGGNSNFLNTGGFGARPEKQPKDKKKENNLSDDEMQFMQQYNKAAKSRKPADRAFLTPENNKKYSDLVHKQNAAQDGSVE